MVRAILDGRKTQTRRVMKAAAPAKAAAAGVFTSHKAYDGQWIWLDSKDPEWVGFIGEPFRCPHGHPGDRLWVREAWAMPRGLDPFSPTQVAEKCLEAGYAAAWGPVFYHADQVKIGPEWQGETIGKQRPSIHMPRWASRIDLEITGVRVERLQDISEADAIAEGMERLHSGRGYYDPTSSHGAVHLGHHYPTAKYAFEALWRDINPDLRWGGPDNPCGWDANPWVWVIEFERVKP